MALYSKYLWLFSKSAPLLLMQVPIMFSWPKVTSLVTDGHAFAKYLSDKDIKLTLTIVNCLQIKAMGHFWVSSMWKCIEREPSTNATNKSVWGSCPYWKLYPWLNKAKLHKYCGVGLVRATSGKDKKGRPKPARLKLPWAVNRRLKNAVRVNESRWKK